MNNNKNILKIYNIGTIENQIYNLTNKINYLKYHFNLNNKDFHSKYGLLIKVNKRKKLLKYIKKKNKIKYINLIKELNIRK